MLKAREINYYMKTLQRCCNAI